MNFFTFIVPALDQVLDVRITAEIDTSSAYTNRNVREGSLENQIPIEGLYFEMCTLFIIKSLVKLCNIFIIVN